MRNFHPSDRGDYEEADEIEEILESLEEQSEINQLLGAFALQQAIMINSDYESDDDDTDFIVEEEDLPQPEHHVTDDETGESNNDDDRSSQNDTSSSSSSSEDEEMPDRHQSERRIIDDYDPNDEDDEVVKKIILELKKERSKPADIITEDFPTDLSFHPEQDLLAVATVMGDVMIYRYSNQENTLVHTHEIHTKAVRDIEFSANGRDLFSCSRDKSIVASDFETGKYKRFWDAAHTEPIYTITAINENLIASGDDEGTVKLWDMRVNGNDPIFSIKEVDDFISCIITNNQQRTLACTSGDGYLTAINIASRKMLVQSEPYEEELTCAGIFRNESKLIVGSSKGNFYTFNWGEFG
jgi:WD repeat-containing protein 55